MSAYSLRRLDSGAVVIATASGGAVYLRPSVASSDRGGGPGSVLDSLKRRIGDPSATVPSRSVQDLALIGASFSNPLDILVIGGGATGFGGALDASTRGLRVGLVEREDFSSGTSSRSTKLIHGGVWYLEKAVFNLDYRQLKLVFHALEERKQEHAYCICRDITLHKSLGSSSPLLRGRAETRV